VGGAITLVEAKVGMARAKAEVPLNILRTVVAGIGIVEAAITGMAVEMAAAKWEVSLKCLGMAVVRRATVVTPIAGIAVGMSEAKPEVSILNMFTAGGATVVIPIVIGLSM
jgi:hypothetical protein